MVLAMTITLVASNDNPVSREEAEAIIASADPAPDFENVVSLNAERAAQNNDGSLVSPREALLDMLRLIDTGEVAPDTLVISFLTTEDGLLSHGFLNASTDAISSISALEMTRHKILRGFD